MNEKAIKFNIYLDSRNHDVKKIVGEVINQINNHQNQFFLEDKRDTCVNDEICKFIETSDLFTDEIPPNEMRFKFTTGGVKNDLFCDCFYPKLRKELYEDKHIIITDKRISNNWFGHYKDNLRVITVNDWRDYFSPPTMDKYLIMMLTKGFLWSAAQLTSFQVYDRFNHLRPCFFGVWENKHEVIYNILQSEICPKCREALSNSGVSEQQFQAVEILLKIMTYKPGETPFGKVFIVHGHDNFKDTVARHIEKLGIGAIILTEQRSGGETIIEKFEKYSSVDFAIVLYTPDDIGGMKNTAYEKLSFRARQNVIFEHGYFTAKLGRKNVVIMLQEDDNGRVFEKPSDEDGIIYVRFDKHDGWKKEIENALRQAEYNIHS